MNRKAFTRVQVVVMLAILGLLPVAFLHFTKMKRRDATCASNLRQIGLAIMLYARDYDAKYPLVASGKEGWTKNVNMYMRDATVFQCPQEANGFNPQTTDYFYNARLGSASQMKLNFAAQTIMNGDGVGDAPTNSSLEAMPAQWRTDADSPAQRHSESMANYSFADGHVKALRPDAVTNRKSNGKTVTFAVSPLVK